MPSSAIHRLNTRVMLSKCASHSECKRDTQWARFVLLPLSTPFLKKLMAKAKSSSTPSLIKTPKRPGRRVRTGTARAGAEERTGNQGGEKKFRVFWEVGEALGKRHGVPEQGEQFSCRAEDA